MSATILDGRKIRNEVVPELIKKVSALSRPPTLTIIQVGDRPDSTSYIKAKKAFATKIGINVKHVQVSKDINQVELVEIIKENNSDDEVKGIIVQLPLPIELDSELIIDTILPSKDVDALTAHNVKRWLSGNENAIIPATARGIKELLKYYKIDLFGKKVTVVGRSTLVGKPIAAMCLNENATVTICHSRTPDLAKETKDADIVIVATGKPNLIKQDHVSPNQVIIDVGINIINDNKGNPQAVNLKVVGDVDFENVSNKVTAITPVPGGVGPMTVLGLFENLLDLCITE